MNNRNIKGQFELQILSISANELTDLYIKNRLTIKDIANKLSSTYWIVRENLIKNKIPIRHGNDRLVRRHPNFNKKFSFETRKKQSLAKLKIKEDEWIGFTPRANFDYGKLKQWSKKIIKRDFYKCRLCHTSKTKENRLEAHHIFTKSQYPQFVFHIENGITLCHMCHVKLRYKEDKFINQFTEMNRNFEIYKWSQLGEINHG